MHTVADPRTLAIYAEEAPKYAARKRDDRANDFLNPFLTGLPAGGVTLDLGCGSGWAAEAMEAAGFDVYALDACKEFADLATPKLKRPVRIASFEQVTETDMYDGIWASGALLHVPKPDLMPLLTQLAAALKPGGLLCATFKAGEGEARDKLGRFYAYYSLDELKTVVESVHGLRWEDHVEARSKDFTGNETTVYGVYARATK